MHFEIDDSIFRDTRFLNLVAKIGDPEKAMGTMLNAWMTAFEFWKNKHPIPRSTWVERGLNDLLIDVGLARYQGDDAIYVSGTERMNEWYHKLIEKGRKGGLKSQANRRSTARAKSTRAKPKQPTYTYPYTYPVSVTDTDEASTNASHSTKAGPLSEKTNHYGNAIAWFCSEYKRRYNSQYRITGKDAGTIKRLCDGLGSEDVYKRIVTAYLDMPDQWFVNKRHDVTTLEANLAKVSQFEQSGQMVTQAQLKDLDRNTTNKALLEKIRRGEL